VTAAACILGCSGPALTAEEVALFADGQPWGFILFGRNIASPDQVRALTAALREAVGRDDAPVLVDQEGGRVQRLGPPHWRRYPPGRAYGALSRLDPEAAVEMARLGGRLLAQDLAAVGITVVVEHRDAAIDLIGHDYLHQRTWNSTFAWQALQEAVESAPGTRVIISNELFAWLEQASVRTLIEALGPDRTRVIFCTRSLEHLATSFWHELVIRGGTSSRNEWFQELRAADGRIDSLENPAARFWHAEDPAALARRWGGVIGPDRMTCVVVSERDPRATLDRIDHALGLPQSELPRGVRVENRSTSPERLEALVRFNRRIAAMRVPRQFRATLARYAHEQLLARHESPAGTQRLSNEVRAWCEERQSRSFNELRELGIDVVGELDERFTSEARSMNSSPLHQTIEVSWRAIVSRVIRRLVQRLTRQ
jgi:hypothetical protein